MEKENLMDALHIFSFVGAVSQIYRNKGCPIILTAFTKRYLDPTREVNL